MTFQRALFSTTCASRPHKKQPGSTQATTPTPCPFLVQYQNCGNHSSRLDYSPSSSSIASGPAKQTISFTSSQKKEKTGSHCARGNNNDTHPTTNNTSSFISSFGIDRELLGIHTETLLRPSVARRLRSAHAATYIRIKSIAPHIVHFVANETSGCAGC